MQLILVELRTDMTLNIKVDTSKFRTTEFKEQAPVLIQAFCEVKYNILDTYNFLKSEADNARFDGFYGLDDVFDLTPAVGGNEYTGHKMRFFDLLSDFSRMAFDSNGFSAGTSRYIGFFSPNFKHLINSNTEFNADSRNGNLTQINRAIADVGTIPGCFISMIREMPSECWTKTVTLPSYNEPELGLLGVRPYMQKFKPKGLYRVRQLLSQITADVRWDDYYEYDYVIEAHMEECDECMEDPDSCDIYNDLHTERSALYDDIMNQLLNEYPIGHEFESEMSDPYSSGTHLTNYFENPLLLVDLDTSAHVVKKNASDISNYTTVPCVTLLRKKALTGIQCYDAAESVFTSGNPNYVFSNYFTWLNDRHLSSKAWQVPSHSEDKFNTNAPSFGYLACCDNTLLQLLTATVESHRKILTKTTVASGTNATYYGLAYATILSAFEYGLTKGSACGTHYPVDSAVYFNSWSDTEYFAGATNEKRKPEIAPVGTQATYLNLITKTALKMTTSSTNPYSLMGGIDGNGAFTGAGLTNYTAIQPAHYLVGFHLDRIVDADTQYLRGVKLVS